MNKKEKMICLNCKKIYPIEKILMKDTEQICIDCKLLNDLDEINNKNLDNEFSINALSLIKKTKCDFCKKLVRDKKINKKGSKNICLNCEKVNVLERLMTVNKKEPKKDNDDEDENPFSGYRCTKCLKYKLKEKFFPNNKNFCKKCFHLENAEFNHKKIPEMLKPIAKKYNIKKRKCFFCKEYRLVELIDNCGVCVECRNNDDLKVKKCAKCKDLFDKGFYSEDNTRKDHLSPYCKLCKEEINKREYEKRKLKRIEERKGKGLPEKIKPGPKPNPKEK